MRWEDLEYRSPKEIAGIQNRLLARQVQHVAERSPFYRELFRKHEIDPRSIRRVEDLRRLPCTAKADLAERNEEFLAVSKEDVSDVCLTSATTRPVPTMIYQTASDLARLAYNEEAAFRLAGVKPDDTLMVCAALDQGFMAGLAYFLGGVKRGACVVRAGSGSAAQNWQMIERTRPTWLVGVPSLMRRMGEYGIAAGGDPAQAGLRGLIAIGEPIRGQDFDLTPAASRLEALWRARLFSTYASTELATTFCECCEGRGGHLRPELIVAEILDEMDRPAPPGQLGEIVATPLGVRGTPLLRFRTGDISFLIDEPCGCGRQTPRLGPVLGRKGHMLKFKGTTVFPASILSVIDAFEGVIGSYVEASRNPDGTDRVVARVAARDASLKKEHFAEAIRARLRVTPEIEMIAQEELAQATVQPGKRKPATFVDLR